MTPQNARFALSGVSRSWSLVGAPPSPAKLFSFLAFAGPIFLVLLGKIACYNSMTLAATSSGVVALAAHQVLASVFFFGCKFGECAVCLARSVPSLYPHTPQAMR